MSYENLKPHRNKNMTTKSYISVGNYTAGPWHAKSFKLKHIDEVVWKVYGKNKKPICEMALNEPNNEANAHIVASSHDLLEACKHLVNILYLENDKFYKKHIIAFNLGMDAISKAEVKS